MAAASNGGARPLALVTGASSGIGRELAKLFAEKHYDLVVAAEDTGIEQGSAVHFSIRTSTRFSTSSTRM